ncbi:hypothetical protein N7494_003079 [Penicillium frequentans]|uniref:Zn(2)-C6 fungal-type domain-containing protein n=1 Tax=Penicillium frequentans TaxID=3151616 RepID=A0AAD6D605_9EURO|nr:hypothetical protein N7494_003079 [Penicillium glabrum]
MGPRRTHRKSRNGCPQCKARRLKCDERHPCTNCVKHGIYCEFVAPTEPQDSTQATPASTVSPVAQSQPQPQSQALTQPHIYPPLQHPISNVGAPVNHHTNETQSGQKFDLLGILSESPPDPSLRAPEDWALDLELMHHYCTMTCNTLTVREDARYVWRVIMPIEGYANPYVMNGLLAIAALHRAFLAHTPHQKERYVNAAAYHITTGLKAFRELIALPLDPKNWQPVFCFAGMINVHLMGTPTRLGVSRWPAPISNVLDLFGSVKGLQALMEPFLHSIRKTQLAALVNSIYLIDPELIPSQAQIAQSLLPPNFWMQASQLRAFIHNYPFAPAVQPGQSSGDSETTSDPTDRRKEYINALDAFERASRCIELAGTKVEWGMVLIFAQTLSKTFHDDVESHEPAALVIMAYYCVLVHLVDDIWFTNGLGWQLMEDIESKISPEYREWLTWPKHWVFERRGYPLYVSKE